VISHRGRPTQFGSIWYQSIESITFFVNIVIEKLKQFLQICGLENVTLLVLCWWITLTPSSEIASQLHFYFWIVFGLIIIGLVAYGFNVFLLNFTDENAFLGFHQLSMGFTHGAILVIHFDPYF